MLQRWLLPISIRQCYGYLAPAACGVRQRCGLSFMFAPLFFGESMVYDDPRTLSDQAIVQNVRRRPTHCLTRAAVRTFAAPSIWLPTRSTARTGTKPLFQYAGSEPALPPAYYCVHRILGLRMQGSVREHRKEVGTSIAQFLAPASAHAQLVLCSETAVQGAWGCRRAVSGLYRTPRNPDLDLDLCPNSTACSDRSGLSVSVLVYRTGMLISPHLREHS